MLFIKLFLTKTKGSFAVKKWQNIFEERFMLARIFGEELMMYFG